MPLQFYRFATGVMERTDNPNWRRLITGADMQGGKRALAYLCPLILLKYKTSQALHFKSFYIGTDTLAHIVHATYLPSDGDKATALTGFRRGLRRGTPTPN